MKKIAREKKLNRDYSTHAWTPIVLAEIDKWISATKDKSILRLRGKYTIGYHGFIYWN